MSQPPDLAAIDAALAPIGVASAIRATELSGGTSIVYRVDLSDGAAVVLKTYGDDNHANPGKDAFAALALRDSGLPISRSLLTDDSKAVLPFRFGVTTYLPGESAATFRDHPDVANVYRQMGALLHSLHAVKMDAYGAFDPAGIVDPSPANTVFMRGIIEHTFAQFAALGGPPGLTTRLRDIVEQGFLAVVGHSSGPVFTHDDLHPNNVLAVEEDGKLRLSGLIDFGNARAADAVFDLAKCLFCSEHDAPGSTAHILAGYGPIDHPHPEQALDYYTDIHRMTMWWWLRHIGVIPSADTSSDLIDALNATIGKTRLMPPP